MLTRRFVQSTLAVLVLVAMLCQGTSVLAGTTGGLSGTVVDATTKQPLSGAKVTAASPSQIATATTDNGGHFQFLSLAPDTYTVSVEAAGYQGTSLSGVNIVADNTRVLDLTSEKELKTIGKVTSRAASSLVKPGTTADVYSVTPVVQQKVAVAGGGGNLDSAWSALATVPGVSVAPGQSGYIGAGATLSIRGGDYDQIGYQIDGVPVNRAFDNYPSGPASSLGQQELQVYTGAPPAGSTSEGISGYINQVIRTGTSPGFTNVDLGIGSPTYWHKLSVETGGETSNRRFSYYVGLGGYNQDYRLVDQFNGAGVSQTYGTPFAVGCGSLSITLAPSCYTGGKNNGGFPLLGYNLFGNSTIADRDSVVNLHYYFPHKDGTRDDLQGLYINNSILTYVYGSTNDEGGATFLNQIGVGQPFYIDGYNLNLPQNGLVNSFNRSETNVYYFPGTQGHTFDAVIPPNEEDGTSNNQAIEKIQYTKSLGSSAYARVYGYSYYSNWLQTGPQCSYIPANCGTSADYELSAHTRGVDFNIADQLNSQNLLQLEGSWTTSSVLRDNNTQMFNGLYPSTDVNLRTAIGVLVNGNNPTNGICYTSAGTPTPCFSSSTGLNGAGVLNPSGVVVAPGAQYATIGEAYLSSVPKITAASCGGGPCQYLVIGNGQYATYNQVMPIFWGASLTDEFRPTSKLTINGGLRLDVYQYQGADTSGGTARAFEYAAYNQEMCISNTTKLVVDKISDLGLGSTTAACPAGYSTANFQNPSGIVTQTYPVFEPRLGFTYSVDRNTVLRGSYGRYAQPPNSAFEQYNFLQSEAPALLYGTYGFQQYGFNSPDHPIPPATSNNYDFSIEHEFPNQISVKVTPFLRSTANQVEQFFLNRATNFVSGLNVGNQTSRGVEFELDKGDFSREGLAAKLSFAYTNSYVKYNTLANGSTVLTPVVNAINQYNSYTKAGGGSACYTEATVVNGSTVPGKPVACSAAGAVANPYYNAPLQSLSAYTSGSTYVPYDTIPAGIGLDASQIGYPYVASIVLNEKVKKLSITPIVQLFAGQRYGDPLATNGIDPTLCTGVLGGSTAGDPRYPYGGAGGSPFNAGTCGTLANGIPNVQTGSFDTIGQYTEPNLLLLSAQLSYDVTKNVTLVANFANIYNGCFGGSNEPWNIKGACGYTYPNAGLSGAIGNTYNPGQALQPIGHYAYTPYWPQQPFNFFVTANIKL
jgi:hypothetical protein